MSSASDHDATRFQALLARHLNESLSDAESQQLDQLLANRPELRETFVEQIWLDTMLQHELESDIGDEVRVTTDVAVSPAQLIQSPAKIQSLAWVASFALITAVIALVLLVANPADRNTSVVGVTDASRHHVAVMLDSEDAQWGDGASPIPGGTRLKRDSSIILKSGLVRLKFNCGAGVVIKGPAHLELCSAREACLHHGQLAVVAPEGAEGFVVLTPEMKITDLGTKFGASVGLNGRANVQVFEGEVEVESRTSPTPSKKVLLNANRRTSFSQSGTAPAEIKLSSVDSIETVSLPSYEQLSAARAGAYPPRKRSTNPLARVEESRAPTVVDRESAIPKGVMLGEDFFPPALSASGAKSPHPWILDSKFARVVYRDRPLTWQSISGGHYVMQIDGRDAAFPFIANRLASRLEQPLEEAFYFSFLAHYEGLDEDDFFSLWFDSEIGEGLSHADRPNAGIRFGEYFTRLHMEHAAYHSTPTDQATFFLAGRLQKDANGRFSTLDIWVNPTSGSPGEPNATSQYTGSRCLNSIAFVGLRMGKNTELSDKLLLDRIVIGKTLHDVFAPTETLTPKNPSDR